jgi:FAD/FMN-containing dehydrogenase
VSGEHGLGWAKRGQLERQWSPAALNLHEQLKRVFDPKGLLNPGKKLARYRPGGHPQHGGIHARSSHR